MPPIEIKNAAVGTPEWFLGRLYGKLVDRRSGLTQLDNYYEGDQRLRFAAERFRKAFGKQFYPFSENVCPLVVDTLEQRLDVIGFRVDTGRKGVFSGQFEDVWQTNQMDAESEIAHSEALTLAAAYVLVWNTDESETDPLITVESAHEMIVEHTPGSRRTRAAALKAWHDDWTGHIHATLYLPDDVHKYRSTRKVDPKMRGNRDVAWERREVEGEPWPLPNRIGRVPVVPLYNRPRLRRPPRSEIADVIPSQDVINKLTMDMLVASEFAAFRQRVLIGVDVPKDPETGQVVEDYWKQSLEAFLILPNENAKATSIEATDLNNYVQAIEHEVQKVATRTQTPPHIFFLRGQFPSGESIVAAESGLVTKARRRMRHFEDGWEEVGEMSFLVMGKRVPLTAIQTVWKDPESRTEAQHADAVGKKRQMLEVPLTQAWADIGYTPAEIERMLKDRAAELAAVPAPQPVPVPATGGLTT